jgi:hypothetical protein
MIGKTSTRVAVTAVKRTAEVIAAIERLHSGAGSAALESPLRPMQGRRNSQT